MARVRYNQSLYRTGFRPNYSDPAAAASGLAGMGQNKAFTPRGGYTLHGLGAALSSVPDGSVVNYQGTWPGSLFGADIGTVISEVVATISKNGWSVTGQNSSSAGLVNNTVSLTILINTGLGGYNSVQDVISIINNAVYQAVGSMPLSGTIASMQLPGTPGQTATGMPAASGAGAPATDLATWFESNALWIGLGIAAVVVLPGLMERF